MSCRPCVGLWCLWFIQELQYVFSLAARSDCSPTGAFSTHLFPPRSITRGPGGSRLVTDTFGMVALGIGPGLTCLLEPAVPGVTWTQIFAQATLTKRPGWAEEKTNKTPPVPKRLAEGRLVSHVICRKMRVGVKAINTSFAHWAVRGVRGLWSISLVI